jgi:hypothetical protein
MPHPDGCPTIEELHARYNGPIPKELRDAANAGGYLRRSLLQAEARAKMWREQVQDWGESLRRQRRTARERGEIGDARERTVAYLLDARIRYREARRHLADVKSLIALCEAEREGCVMTTLVFIAENESWRTEAMRAAE